MKKNRSQIYILLILFLSQAHICPAKEVSFEATVDRSKVTLGQSLQLNLTFNGTQDMPVLELPHIEGLESRYLGPSTSMSIINGQVSSSITHVYTLVPLKTGEFKIGPLKFEHKADTYNSNAISFEAVEGPVQEDTQAEGREETETKDISDRVYVVMQVEKEKIYLNELVPLMVKLYVNRLGIRDIQYPEISHEGFSLGQFQQPKQYQEAIGGVNYDVIEFNTAFFALRTGELKLGPAQLKCNLIVKKEKKKQSTFDFDSFGDSSVFEDFFGRYQTYPLNLKSAETPVTVMDIPQDGRPEGFTGTIGDFDLEVDSSPKEVKVGDPVTLKIAVKGEGNFNTVNIPQLKTENGFKTYEPQVKQEAAGKIFEQVLIPMNENVKEIPGITFSFFNPKSGQYQVISKGPFPIKVLKSEREENPKIIESAQIRANPIKEEKLGRDIIYIKTQPGRLIKKGAYLFCNPGFLVFQIFPLLSFLLILIIKKIKTKLMTDLRYARKLRAPNKARAGLRIAANYLAKGNKKEFYDKVFQTLQEYLGDKFHLPSQGITISIIDDILKDKKVSPEVLDKLKSIFKNCDMARYAAGELNAEDMLEILKKLEETIDYFQRNRL